MTYTILSATYANPDSTAAVLKTEEAGDVIASQADTPELWAQMLQGAVQPFPLPTLAEKQAEMWERIKTKRDALSDTGGYLVAGKWFHSDNKSKTQQLALFIMGASVPPVPWKTMDGSFVTMTQALAAGIFQAAAAQDQAIFSAAETHNAAMLAAADPLAYDFSGGWPATFPG